MNPLDIMKLVGVTVGLVFIVVIGMLALIACRRALSPDSQSASRSSGREDDAERVDPWAESAARLHVPPQDNPRGL